MDNAEIREIVAAYRAGEAAAMPQLVSRFRSPVFGLCYRMLGQWQDAEDAVQETFLRVARSISRWDPARDFEPWLLAIAANCCRTQLQRRNKRLDRAGIDAIESTPAPEVCGHRLDAEELELALAKLPTDWETAFRLFHQEAVSYREIALRLGRPEGTVKTWVHRARRQLVDILQRRDSAPSMRGAGR